MNMILMGPPGAGKGTHAKLLSERFKIPHVATGDLLRMRTRDGSELGRRAKEIMNQGQLVPDEIVVDMIRERLKESDARGGFILDGFPRTVSQAEALEHLLKELHGKLDVVLDFEVTNDVVIQRLSGRRVCPNCNTNYHAVNLPPKREGVCDACGTPLIRRKDDDPKTVQERLEVYERQTTPLIDYYEKRGVRRAVNADLDIEPLQKELEELFHSIALI